MILKKQNGASAVEFAILLPFLVLLVFGIIEFGVLMYNQQVLTNASREGARAAIVGDCATRLDDTTTSGIGKIVQDYCASRLITFASTNNPPTTVVTDFPVEEISPVLTFYAAVARMDKKGFPEGGFQVENALSVLLGGNPAPIQRGKSIDELIPPAVPAGLPSELLERRPDIRQAEEDLIAANARIGVARGLYFPTISLTGFNGTASAEFDELFSGPASVWNYGGQLTVPIFTAGGIAGIVKASEAVQQQALARYRQAIENGFREVDDSLIDQQKSRQRLAAQARQVAALRTYAGTARLRFDEGYTSYIEVLDAERSLFNVERSYAQTQATLLQSLVNLYKAMGGGWVTEADRMTADSASAAPSGEAEKSSPVQ